MKKKESKLPPLCVAVKFVREGFDDTQERFARRIGVAVMTVSKFENGRAEPRDPRVLARLYDAASEKGLEREAALFREAIGVVSGDPLQSIYAFRHAAPAEPTLKQWRIMTAVRILTTYYPEHMPKLIEALGPALGVVDAALQAINDSAYFDYNVLDREVNALAERRALLELKQGRKEQ